MNKKVFDFYKIPFLMTITLSIILIALNTLTEAVDIFYVISGSFIGFLVLELEYIIGAYFVDPNTDFSRNIRAYIKHKDINNLIKYVHTNDSEIKDKAISSALFQICYSLFAIFGVSSTGFLIIKTIILSLFLHLLYRSLEAYFNNKADEWFWALKSVPSKQQFMLYLLGTFAVFIYCLIIF